MVKNETKKGKNFRNNLMPLVLSLVFNAVDKPPLWVTQQLLLKNTLSQKAYIAETAAFNFSI